MTEEEYTIIEDDVPEMAIPRIYIKLIAKSLRDAERYKRLLDEYVAKRCGR